MSFVFIRLDKIGDLIATLPVDSAVQPKQVKWVIADGLGWIAKASQPEREFVELSLKKEDRAKACRQLVTYLKKEKPEAVVIFYAPWWASLACWVAGIPIRGGRISQWQSYLFLNRGLRQSRSQALIHEADYNRELVEHVFNLPKRETSLLQMEAAVSPHLLEKFDLQVGAFRVVHPGMFGSALNWSQAKYNQLIEQLIVDSVVVVTGTKNDERFLTDIKAKWQHHPRVRILQDKLSMQDLLSLLKMARSVVAPSTGVLHLASALGTPSLGIYSPVLVHHPRRWGPRGKFSQFVLPTSLQNKSCPATDSCLLEKCPLYNCMESTPVASVIQLLQKLEHAKQQNK